MTLANLTDPDAVVAAVGEFDRLGRSAFLNKYGFGESRSYFLVIEGNTYDSKAVAGAAYGYQFPESGPLNSSEFSGGEAGAAGRLRALGFHVDVDDTPAQIAKRFRRITVANLAAGVRAPHKPLLCLLALRELRRGHKRLVSPDQYFDELSGLLVEALPDVASPRAWEPIWRLETDVWELSDGDGDLRDLIDSDDPPVRQLGEPSVRCGLTADVFDALAETPDWIERIENDIVDRFLDDVPNAVIAAARGHDRPPRTWWVNQKKTYRQERDGSYIWAPTKNRKGDEMAYHRAVADVRPGDVILHYANGAIAAIGSVTSSANIVPKPNELGDDWGSEGYSAGVDYFELDKPIALNELTNRPASVGPFNRDSGVIQGYLFELPNRLSGEIRDEHSHRWPAGSPWTEPPCWLFQANPDRWSLVDRLATWQPNETGTWLVRQYKDDIHTDDRVLLFMSGQDGGLFALATVTSEPYESLAPDWLDTTEPVLSVDVALDAALTDPLTRSELKEHPVLKDLAVLKFANATNFKVTPKEWNAVQRLIENRNTTPAPSDSRRIRRRGDPDYGPTYDAAAQWRDISLLSGASLFDPRRQAWTAEVVAEVRHRLVEQVDDSNRSFSEKLVDQLRGASQEAHLLVAEILYIHLLAVLSVSAEKKLENINGVGALAPEPFEVPAQLVRPLSLGLVNGGAGFNTNRYHLVVFLLAFAAHWSELPDTKRAEILDDPWAFKDLLAGLPQERANAQRNAVLFLLFPDTFEDIVSKDHKRRIVEGFRAEAGDDHDLDRQLLAARGALSERFWPDFSWYSNEVRPLWDVAKSPQVSSNRQASLSEDIEDLFPTVAERLGFLRAMADAIMIANSGNSSSWSVTYRKSGIYLNVGPNRAIHADRAGRGFLVLGSEVELASSLAAADIDAVLTPFSFPQECYYVNLESEDSFDDAFALLSEQFAAAIGATAIRNTPFYRSFSEEAVVYLEESLGIELTRPSQIQPVLTGTRAWIVRVKRDDGTGPAEALADDTTKIFWNVDIPAGSPIDDVKAALKLQDPDQSNNKLGNAAGNIHRFISRMKPGDLVVMPDKLGLYFGTVVGDAVFEPITGEWARDVEWANADAPVDRDDASPALYSRLRTLLTVTDISDLADEVRSFVDSDVDQPRPSGDVRLSDIDDDTAKKWMLDRDWLQEVVDMLSAKKQIIFYGPPGTGKTYLAKKLADHLAASGGSYQVVQFHPSYSYEDFVEGFRPRVTDGNMTYELSPGPVKKLAQAARENPGDPYFLIIDEINRGNLAKIFGELYFLLEYRDESLILQYGSTDDDEFSLPKNLFVIGTMNTADRSIAMVDAAIRRRFYFVEFSPTEKPISGLLREWLQRRKLGEGPALLLEKLNDRLDDSDYAIGPSYLMTDRVDQQSELERIWKYAIMPLLTEHFYGQPGATEQFELSALKKAITAPEHEAPAEAQGMATGGGAGADDNAS